MGPLKSNPKRQAVATLKGFSYQIWQSVLRWLSLKDEEVIFLEGAEDIDVLGPSQAETVQVKETAGSGPITLRSPDVLAAITHLWEHQLANPDIKITFRFLTTADRAHERPNPFSDKRGLDLWDSCKYPGTDIGLLKDFLMSQEALPLALRSFIATASDEDIRDRLFKRIEWDTGNKTQPYVEDSVNKKVIAYGDRMLNLLPSESIKLVPHLLQYAWDVVRREKGRCLELSDFRRLFEEVMAERVGRTELQSLRRAAQQQAQLMSQFSPSPAVQAGGPYSSRPFASPILEEFSPPDTHRLAQRQELVAGMHSRLNVMGILVIKGSTGMGKSMLANMVARQYKGTWRRLDLRGHAPEQIAERLNYATQLVEGGASQVDCIIDDLNFDTHTTVYENSLGKFIYVVRLHGGRVIMTTQGSMPSRIVNLYDIPGGSFADVTLLSEDEVKELAANYGCPEGHRLKGWGRIVFLTTQGHPLLAHARVRNLENRSWPSPAAEDLSAVQDLGDIRREFRRALHEQLSTEARLLLYRLSIIGNRFRRQNALDIGSLSPRVPAPGESFDQLLGPWVEPVDATHFRLSPLLDNAASEVFTDIEVRELHRAAATSFASQETIDPLEISAVLLHGYLGQAQEPLFKLVMSIFKTEESYWSVVSRVIDWFGYLQLESGKKLFKDNPLLNVLLRRLQYKVVATLHPDRAVNVAEIWRQEIDQLSGQGSPVGTKTVMLFTFLNEALFSIEVPFPMRRIVAYISQAVTLSRDYGAFFPDRPEHREEFEGKVNAVVTPYRYLGVAIGRCKRAADVVDFLTALDEQSDGVTEDMWTTFKRDDYLAMMLIDRIWLDEAATSAPDWSRCLRSIEIAAQLAKKRDATALLAAAYRARATVQEEYIKNTDDALRTLSEADVALGGPYPFLQDYRAKMLLFKKRYEEALNIWQEMLPGLERGGKLGLGPSYRDAEICAARVGDWRKAAEFARKGEEATRQSWDGIPGGGAKATLVDVIAAGFKADYAFALWNAGDRASSVREFAEILKGFKYLPPPEEDIKSELLYKRVGHAIGWLNQSLEGDDSFAEPPPGCFSDPEVINELKETQTPPPVALWYLLAKVECSLKIGDAVFRLFEEENPKVTLLPYTVGYLDLRIRHSLRNLQIESLVADGLKQSVSLKAYSAEQQMNSGDWSNAEMVKRLVFAALVLVVGSGRYDVVPVDQWRRDALSHEELKGSLNAWFDFIERNLSADSRDLVTVLIDNSAAYEFRLVAALLLSADDSLDVENRFYANALLTTPDFHKPWQAETENIVALLIIDKWLWIAERERFSLRAPSVTAPLIINACCDESCHGLPKAARVLLAVRAAVKARITDSVLEQIQQQAR